MWFQKWQQKYAEEKDKIEIKQEKKQLFNQSTWGNKIFSQLEFKHNWLLECIRDACAITIIFHFYVIHHQKH